MSYNLSIDWAQEGWRYIHSLDKHTRDALAYGQYAILVGQLAAFLRETFTTSNTVAIATALYDYFEEQAPLYKSFGTQDRLGDFFGIPPVSIAHCRAKLLHYRDEGK